MRDIKDLCARIEDELAKIAGVSEQHLCRLFTPSLMKCVADTMTITASAEENVAAWGDTAAVMEE